MKFGYVISCLLYVTATSAATWSASWSNVHLSLLVSIDDVGGTADVQLIGQHGSTGWYGFGVGSSMGAAEFFVMWTNPDSSTTISVRTARAFLLPPPSSNQSIVTNLEPSSNQGSFHFKIPLSTSEYSFSSQTSNFIWAYASQTPTSSSTASSFVRHIASGGLSLAFTTGSTPTPTASAPGTGSGNGTNIGPPGGGSDDGSDVLDSFLIITHATLGFAAWALLAPISVYLARFGRHLSNWVPAHYNIQVFGVALLTVAASVVGFVGSFGAPLITPHQIIGVVILGGMFLQIFLGWLIHHLYNPQRTHRPARNHLHRLFGGSLLLLGMAEIPLGLLDYGATYNLFVAYYCWLGAWAAAFLGLTLWQWMRQRSIVEHDIASRGSGHSPARLKRDENDKESHHLSDKERTEDTRR